MLTEAPSIKEDSYTNKNLGKMLDAMDDLSEEEHSIFILREIEECSWEEIKKILKLDKSIPALRKQYQRFKEKFREKLEN